MASKPIKIFAILLLTTVLNFTAEGAPRSSDVEDPSWKEALRATLNYIEHETLFLANQKNFNLTHALLSSGQTRLTGRLQTISESVDQVLVGQKEIEEQFTSLKEDVLQSTQRDQPSNSSDYISERILYLLEDISARQSNLEQKIDEDRQRLSKRAKDTDKIDDMNSHLLNVSIQQSRLEHKLDSLLELQAKYVNLSSSTTNEDQPAAVDEANKTLLILSDFETNCGGSLVADSGNISFQPSIWPYSSTPGKSHCIWTVRTNKSSDIRFTFANNSLGSQDVIILTPIVSVMKTGDELVTSEGSVKLDSNSAERMFTVRGPIVFITLTTSFSSDRAPKFDLAFETQGGRSESFPNYTFKHYDYKMPEGTIKYPPYQMGQDVQYRSYEIATFTVNTFSMSNASPKEHVNIARLDLEGDDLCRFDSLTILEPFADNDRNMLARNGPSSTDYRFCGEESPPTTVFLNSSTFIFVFKSDTSNVYSGFTLDWKPIQ